MVVRKHSGLPPVVLYSAAGGFAAIVTLIFAARSVMIPDPVPTCEARYSHATVLPYSDRQGTPLTPADLQAKLLERDWGLEANTRIVKVSGVSVSGADTPAALDIQFREGGAGGGTVANPVSGIGFKWMPSFLRKASSACLSYNVWLPADFRFGDGGVLPGLFGGNPNEASVNGEKPFFAVRMQWLKKGRIALRSASPSSPRGYTDGLGERGGTWPRGRWVPVTQEVILNAPGKANGTLRIWVDDELRLDRKNVAFRNDASYGLTGVWADTHFVPPGGQGWQAAPAGTHIRLSPFVVRWQ